jgi:hypothetical protein
LAGTTSLRFGRGSGSAEDLRDGDLRVAGVASFAQVARPATLFKMLVHPAGAPLLSGAKHAQLASCLLGEQDVIARLGECSQGLLFTGSCPSSVASARQRAVSSAVGVSASSFGARVW